MSSTSESWQRRLEDTFAGPSDIVAERMFELFDKENMLTEMLKARFYGHMLLMDCSTDLYLETLQMMTRSELLSSTPMDVSIYLALHITSFWRFRASYLLYQKGYFAEVISLLRAVFESALHMSALKLKIVDVGDLFGKLTTEDAAGLPDDERIKQIENCFRKSDKKIMNRLIWKNRALSKDALEDLRIFVRLLHYSVHKSKLNVFMYYAPWSKGEAAFPIYPSYNEELVRMCINYATRIGWMVIRTLPLLQTKENELPETWWTKYRVLDESFVEDAFRHPRRMARSVRELIDSSFDFGYARIDKK